MEEKMNGTDEMYAVRIAHLRKVYQDKAVIKDLSLDIPAGGIFGLLGPNGAGKTTLMKAIAGLVRPTSGRMTVFGEDALRRSPQARRRVGLIPQDNNLERELTVEEALTVYGRLFGVADLKLRVEQTIVEFSLEAMRKKRVRFLSGGMMRRVLIARCLMPEPELLLLDEPTVGLDPDVRQDIWKIVERLVERGKTVILTTHYMEEAVKLCKVIAMMRLGELAVLDTPAGIQSRFDGGSKTENLEALFIELAKEKR